MCYTFLYMWKLVKLFFFNSYAIFLKATILGTSYISSGIFPKVIFLAKLIMAPRFDSPKHSLLQHLITIYSCNKWSLQYTFVLCTWTFYSWDISNILPVLQALDCIVDIDYDQTDIEIFSWGDTSLYSIQHISAQI